MPMGENAGAPAGEPAERPTGPARNGSALGWKLALVAIALMWGFSFFVMKDALATLPTFLLLGIRFTVAALVMLALYRQRIARSLADRRVLVVGIAMGAFMGGGYVFQTLGLNDTTPGKNAFLTGTYCILVPFISYALAREPLTRYNMGAAVLCLSGIGLVALDNLTVSGGDLLTLVGAIFFALEIAFIALYGKDLDVNAVTFWMFATIGVGCLLGAFAVEPMPAASVWTPSLLGTLAFLSLGCTCVGLLVQNVALPHVPSATGSLLLSLESPSGVFFSVVMAGEVLTGRLVAGFALIFLSIVLSETHFSFLRRLVPARP